MSHDLSIFFDETAIDAIFADYDQCHLPGVAVGIGIDGVPAYRKGFGLASIELPLTLGPSIRMRIGSTSKQFAAFAFLLLCDDGLAAIDEPIKNYLPELHPVAHGVTFRQLMANTSGLRDVIDMSWQFDGTSSEISSAELLARYRSIDDVNAPPGTTWIYNNGGYLILSSAIERITGQPFEDVLRERIFEPVGMFDTLVRRRESVFVPNSATLHDGNPVQGYRRSTYFGTEFMGEGGIASTVDDMLRWLAHMETREVGSAAAWEALTTPTVLPNGACTNYALGLFRSDFRGATTLSHAGGGQGGTCQMVKVPNARLDVVVLSNRGEVDPVALADSVVACCLPALPADRALFAPRVRQGTYVSERDDRVIEVRTVGNRLLVGIDGMDVPFAEDPASSGRLRPTGAFAYANQSLEVPVCGDGCTLRFTDYGVTEAFEYRPHESGDNAVPPLGVFRSRTGDVVAELALDADGACFVTRAGYGSVTRRLTPIAAGVWRAAIPGAMTDILTFDADGGRFRLSSNRTRGLVFDRAS